MTKEKKEKGYYHKVLDYNGWINYNHIMITMHYEYTCSEMRLARKQNLYKMHLNQEQIVHSQGERKMKKQFLVNI